MKRFIVPIGLTVLLLAGCGSTGKTVQDDRQFASNARTEHPENPTASSTTTTIATGRPTSSVDESLKVDPSAPFGTRGAPETAYLLDANTITIVDITGNAAGIHHVSLAVSHGELLRDVAVSPSGDRAAVLISDTTWSSGSLRIAMIDRAGNVIATSRPLDGMTGTPIASPVATPIASPSISGDGTGIQLSGRPSMLTWSPDGDSLVVTEAGSTVAILRVGNGTFAVDDEIVVDAAFGRVVGAWMSPRGDRIMVMLADAEGGQSIATILLTGEDRRPHVVWPGTDERRAYSVRDAAWLPDGRGILFTRGDRSGNAGNLYEVSLADLKPQVVATAGRAGPSGRVGSFAISPDGRSVAYTLESPSEDGTTWAFHSLWVRTVQGGAAIEVATGNTSRISAPIWMRAGLLWSERHDLVVARSGIDTEVIATRGGENAPWSTERGTATPAGSPVASPVATPNASPVASPGS